VVVGLGWVGFGWVWFGLVVKWDESERSRGRDLRSALKKKRRTFFHKVYLL